MFTKANCFGSQKSILHGVSHDNSVVLNRIVFLVLWLNLNGQRCMADNLPNVSEGFRHQQNNNIDIIAGQKLRLQNSCASRDELLYHYEDGSGSRCVTEKLCFKILHVVHKRTEECLQKCPAGFTNSSGYCEHNEVCGSMEIINSLSRISDLYDCKVIEGSLHIVHVKNVTETDWEKWSFPKLVEITNFLVVYHAYGLRSLGQLFPNLAVIRGMTLHQNYALIIYEARHMENVGLYSLRSILRGSVRIQRNINLCYVHTVNWTRIVENYNDNVFKENSEMLCKGCCLPCKTSAHCWSSSKPQHDCSPNCANGCSPDGKCCHELCAGGCFEPNNHSRCSACHHYRVNDTCVETCPEKYLEYKGYRCVTRSYCRKKNLLHYEPSNKRKQCVAECPEGYNSGTKQEGSERVNICKKCDAPCAKHCPGKLVNTVARAQELKGCTIIDGPLIISIKYGKTVTKELEASLSTIQRVKHYIRIFDTSPLKSLNFLPNLKVIDGTKLYNDNYAFYVHGNINLEEIWKWGRHPNLTITEKRGKILFHSNPRLCYHQQIEKLLHMTGQTITEDCNMKLTNGNKVACLIMDQSITLKPQFEEGVVLMEWHAPSTNEDDRKITGYYIYYKETNTTDVEHMDGRDACDDNWKKSHVKISRSHTIIRKKLTGLKPDTQYAVYVETDTVASANFGARSNVSFTTTKPFNPSRPLNLKVIHKGTNDIEVEWSPPLYPNGKIFHYVISREAISHQENESQDVCQRNWIQSEKNNQSEETSNCTESIKGSNGSDGQADNSEHQRCCVCTQEPLDERQEKIDFEDRLYDFLHVHSPVRRKRSLDNFSPASNQLNSAEDTKNSIKYEKYVEEKKWWENDKWMFRTTEQSFRFNDLRYFTRYRIKVVACYQPTDRCPHNMKCVLCSQTPCGIEETTKAKVGADRVSALDVSNVKQSSAEITWSPPNEPNGPVLAYRLSIRSASETGETIPEICLTPQDLNETGNVYMLNTLTPATLHSISVEAYTGVTGSIDEVATIEFKTEGEESKPVFIIVVIFLLLLFVCGGLVFRRVMHREPNMSDISENPSYAQDQSSGPSIISSEHILESSDLQLEECYSLGEGNFGIVYKGKLTQGSNSITVAAKEASGLQAKENILQEAKLMLNFNCKHLVHAYGVVIGPSRTFLVMEYMSRGDLRRYLRSLKAQNNDILTVLSLEKVCDMAIQIADGMAYLASHKIVHRDLAARNCLVSDELKIKISDFGLTRITDKKYYQISGTKPLPVRWLAPENHTKDRFTIKSDVWSFGVVFWEILTGGATPYKNLENNKDVRYEVSHGYTLKDEMPEHTPTFLSRIILSCWEFNEKHRPYFPQIIAALLQDASPDFQQFFREVSFYHSANGQEYKQQVDAIKDTEEESDLPTPLSTPSSPLFREMSSIHGPPLPPKPLSNLKWRLPSIFQCDLSPSCTQHRASSIPLGISHGVSLPWHGRDERYTKVNMQTTVKRTLSSPVNNASLANEANISPFVSNRFSFGSYNDRSICQKFAGSTSNEENKITTLQNPPPSRRNMIVNINKHGLPSSNLSDKLK